MGRVCRLAALGTMLCLTPFLARAEPSDTAAAAAETPPPAPLASPDASAASVGAPAPATNALRRPLPERLGYAFERPELLLRQRLLGLAHGLRLLGRTCLFDSPHSLDVERAYSTWRERERATLAALVNELERWHFGSASAGDGADGDVDARLRELAAALGLPMQLRALTPNEQQAACASYAPAIAGARYDFTRLLALASAPTADAAPAPVQLSPAPAEATVALPTAPADAAPPGPENAVPPAPTSAPPAGTTTERATDAATERATDASTDSRPVVAAPAAASEIDLQTPPTVILPPHMYHAAPDETAPAAVSSTAIAPPETAPHD